MTGGPLGTIVSSRAQWPDVLEQVRLVEALGYDSI